MKPMSRSSSDPVSLPQTGDWRILLRCFRYLRPYWRLAAGAYLSLIAINAMTLAIPQFIRWIIDRGIDAHDLQLLGWSVGGLLLLTAGKGFVTYLQGRWSEVMSQGVAYDLRNALHAKLAALSFAYHDRTETGQLLSRAVQDVDRVRFLTGRAILRTVDSGVLLIGTTVVLVSMNPMLALLSLATMPFLIHRAYEFGRRNRPLSVALQEQLGVLTTQVEQALRGARVVKAFAQEDRQSELFDIENNKWFNTSAAAARLRAVNTPLLDFIANLGSVAVIWYGGTLVINGQLSLGELVAFSTYLAQLVPPVRRIGMIIPAISMAVASGERIFDILDAPSEVQDAPDAIPLPPVQGHIVFENVSFGYLRRHRVLSDVSFEAKPGEVVALLGATGSGKSSIINLIPRFYDPTEGRVLIDGYDLRQIQLQTLRDQVGIVLQETTLFAATMEENIAFGRPDATHEDVVEAAKAAQAHDFILRMPEGYATGVGERGVTLSGGQKQRVAIARALLKDPRILILDDATASVDTETERQIQAALARLMQGRTSVVIAQRLSTVRMANLILVLEKGRIAAQGNHQELLQRSPLYAEIYERQLRPQAQDEQLLPPSVLLQPRTSAAD
ncbi:MAG: ABC transporter ATP-binding protein [Caldilineaceae bacterium]|nr:ABC transporter ATP-binding protein [Caldilineaceae bacterium]